MKEKWNYYIPKETEELLPIPIEGINNTYMASSKGYIINTNYRMSGETCILKETTNRYGYKTVCLYKNNKSKTYKVHRLIALTFIPNPLNLKEVNHINGDKSDNSVENLEWSDRTHNMKHAVETGLHRALRGNDHPGVVYSDKQIHRVCKYLEKGRLSVGEIALKTGVSLYTVSAVLHYSVRRDISKDYNFSNYDAMKMRGKLIRKFTENQIKNVCMELVKRELPMNKISEKTGVSYTVVKLINARKYKPYEYIFDQYDF